jgi:hypothetical protein
VELTQEHLRVAYSAWAAAQDGGGISLDDPGLYPAAIELADQGWLRRRFVTEPGELSWWWTAAADTALALSGLTDVEGRPELMTTLRAVSQAGSKAQRSQSSGAAPHEVARRRSEGSDDPAPTSTTSPRHRA